jgi:RNA polymerase-interacting CarD/CdnL/TRCF family regulator
MNFHVGDKVIHWAYGLGEIVQIDEKIIQDRLTKCYVFRASSMMIWVPIDDLSKHNLRLPTLPDEFNRLYKQLTGPCEKLTEDRNLRKDQLIANMKDGQLSSLIKVVRDLTNFKRSNKLNDHEKSILERATNLLLAEWSYCLNLPERQAEQAMLELLGQ